MTEFKVNQNMIDVINCFNNINVNVADALLSRIFQNPYQSFNSLFSLKEREKILKKTNLEEDQIINVLNGFSFVLIQAIAERNFPTIEKTLKENGLSDEHSKILNENWVKYSSDLIVSMREKPVAVTEEVKQFNWSIQLPIENSKLPIKNSATIKGPGEKIDHYDELFSIDARNPTAILNFTLQDNNIKNQQKQQDFCVRLTKGQIQNLFENMEQLQEQLDLLL